MPKIGLEQPFTEEKMLVLSRKPGEEIIIGNNIRVTVTRITGNRVTIGVQAPSDVCIIRGELESFTQDEFDDAESSNGLISLPGIELDEENGFSDLPRTAR